MISKESILERIQQLLKERQIFEINIHRIDGAVAICQEWLQKFEEKKEEPKKEDESTV